MKKLLLFIMCAAAVFFSRAAASADQFEQGKHLYSEKCVICHGAQGNGEGPAGLAFSPHPTNFTTSGFWERKDIDRFIATTIREGHGPMPSFALSSEEIQAITDYMTRTFKPGTK
ncbi:MAG: cytochrome c [Deltaproteobacteria bacterium]